MSLIGSSTLPAQNGLPARTIEELDRAGFGLYDISVFSGYSTTSLPFLSNTQPTNSSYNALSSGIMTSIGWRARKSETLNFDIRYSPMYYYQTTSTGYSRSGFSPHQSLSLSWDKKLNDKWSAAFSLSGSYGSFNQLLLQPTTEQSLALLPGSVAVLADPASGASTIITPQQSLYYGRRFLTASAQTSLTYSITPRLNIVFGVGASRMQRLRDSELNTPNPSLFRQTTALFGSLGMRYELSPRTNFLATARFSRAISSLATTPSASLLVGFSRVVTERLAVHALVGAGYILPNSTQRTSFQRAQLQASGGLTYRAFRQTFYGTVSRSASDFFGLGATATVSAGGGWNWSPQRGTWGISAGARDTWLQGVVLGRNGYNFNVGVQHSLTRKMHMMLSYGYGSYSNGSAGALLTGGVGGPLRYNSQAVRLSFGWSPYLGIPDGGGGIDPIP